METTLFLLCPTDCLESKINEEFKGDNLFYTSLANNSSFDSKTIREIEELVNRYSIKEVYFVLSKQNKIISKVMIGQSFSQIRGLQNFNSQINKHKEHSMLFWDSTDILGVIISYYINQKIEQLKENFRSDINKLVSIKGKIYLKSENKFLDIHSKIVCLNKLNLN
jgi:hypothetical protein